MTGIVTVFSKSGRSWQRPLDRPPVLWLSADRLARASSHDIHWPLLPTCPIAHSTSEPKQKHNKISELSLQGCIRHRVSKVSFCQPITVNAVPDLFQPAKTRSLSPSSGSRLNATLPATCGRPQPALLVPGFAGGYRRSEPALWIYWCWTEKISPKPTIAARSLGGVRERTRNGGKQDVPCQGDRTRADARSIRRWCGKQPAVPCGSVSGGTNLLHASSPTMRSSFAR